MVTRGLMTGAVLTASTAGVMMIAGSVERGSPWAGLNAMATVIGAGGRRVRDRFDPAVTPVGVAVLAGGLLAWGVAYERALDATGRRSSLAAGALSGALAYALDRLLLPRWAVPSFRRAVGLGGTIATYATLGIASAVMARRRRAGEEVARGAIAKEATGRGPEPCLDEAIAAAQRLPADS